MTIPPVAETPAQPGDSSRAPSSLNSPSKANGRTVWRSPFAVSMLSGLLFWLALPPLEWWPLAWIACVPWLRLAQAEAFASRRAYWQLWASGFVFWLVTLYWIALPHWSLLLGWLALAGYLAVYTPVFVGLVRVARLQLRMSPVVSAPLIWVGLELVRAHLFSGFLMGVLGHTQYRWVLLLQISDVAGAYAVSGLLVLGAACVERLLPKAARRPAWWPAVVLLLAAGGTLAYGKHRTAGEYTRPGPRVALIQGSMDSQLIPPEGHNEVVARHYLELSRQAVNQYDDLDLIVWPEAMFRSAWREFDDDYVMPPDAPVTIEQARRYTPDLLASVVKSLRVPLLTGIESLRFRAGGRTLVFNSAVGVDASGQVTMHYDKCHLVPFGEFIPFADQLPWLYEITPVSGSTRAGEGPEVFDSGGLRYAPSICYESTVPHVFREHTVRLTAQGREPDVLVNLTNDGWFYGSTELDMHLACGVFRAIESRKPLLIAANTGFSAWIDGDGRILAQGPRRAPAVLLARPQLDSRHSPYLWLGDWPAGLCLLATVVIAAVGFWTRASVNLPEPPSHVKLPAIR